MRTAPPNGRRRLFRLGAVVVVVGVVVKLLLLSQMAVPDGLPVLRRIINAVEKDRMRSSKFKSPVMEGGVLLSMLPVSVAVD